MWISRISNLFPVKSAGYRRNLKMIASQVVSLLYPAYCKTHNISRTNINKDIVVSLTSYPARIGQIHLTVQSILRQTLNAGRIILYLSDSDFPDKTIPAKLEQLTKYGLEIIFVDENIRSYKKFYYIATESPDKIIITADDDVIYPEDWIERLYEAYSKNRNSVVCFRAHEITFKSDGSFNEYNKWNMHSIGVKGPSFLLVPTGVSGVLYPPGFFREEDLHGKPFWALAPTADDLWLKAMEIKNEYPVVKVDRFSYYWFETRGSQETSLKSINIHGENMNDIAMNNLDRYYHLSSCSVLGNHTV